MEKKEILKESLELRKARVKFQKENGVNLRTQVIPNKKKFVKNRDRKKVLPSFHLGFFMQISH